MPGLAGSLNRMGYVAGARRHRPDYGITLIAAALLILSLIVVYSVSPALELSGVDYFIWRQLAHVFLGVLAFLAGANIPLSWWRRAQPFFIGISALSSVLLLVPGLGRTVNGATRWLDLGPLSFQPAELLKFSLLLYLAHFLATRRRHHTLGDRSYTLYPLLIILGVVGSFISDQS